jgi:hypothetical protein
MLCRAVGMALSDGDTGKLGVGRPLDYRGAFRIGQRFMEERRRP